MAAIHLEICETSAMDFLREGKYYQEPCLRDRASVSRLPCTGVSFAARYIVDITWFRGIARVSHSYFTNK
jgi:hypothetical protein